MHLTHEQKQQKAAELRAKLHSEQDTSYFLQQQLGIKTLDTIARAHYEAEKRKCDDKVNKIRQELERLRGGR